MKITIEIPDAHTGSLLEFLAALSVKSSPVEAVTDPAPGHPEFSLDQMIDAAQAKADALTERIDIALAGIDAADPIKVSMSEEPDRLPRLVPVIGKTYRTRHGQVIKMQMKTSTGRIYGETHNGGFFYDPDGSYNPKSCFPDWDLVEAL